MDEDVVEEATTEIRDLSTSGADLRQDPDFGDEGSAEDGGYEGDGSSSDESATSAEHSASAMAPLESARPFENLAALPPDMADAMESFKLSILRHKLNGWTEVAAEDVLEALAGLRHLVMSST